MLNIGWLGEGNFIPTGDVPAEFTSKLEVLCEAPIHLHRGFHGCEYCHEALGNGQIRVARHGTWYAAPTMIHHYVDRHLYCPPNEFVEAVLNPDHVADSKTEADQFTWDRDIRTAFPHWQTEVAASHWQSETESLKLGQQVSGLVVARAPFGVWVDIGVSFPALLLVPNMAEAQYRSVQFTDYAPKGTLVSARINVLAGEKCEIGLTQRNSAIKTDD